MSSHVKKSNPARLIADIGGTNLRIGITDHHNNISAIKVYQCNNYDSLHDIVADYIAQMGEISQALVACFAIACPVEEDQIKMTNLPWSFSKAELQKKLGLQSLSFINDYTAIAHAVPSLTNEQKVKIGEGSPVALAPISICGPGTGLGVANLVNHNNEWISLSGEGGHSDFAPSTKLEVDILQYLFTKYDHVSYEQLLSGLGIEQIYQALQSILHGKNVTLSAPDITKNAIDNSCSVCKLSLDTFCRILGAYAGNLALTLGSFGGVYIAGGIVPRFIEYVSHSAFREGFESKGRFRAFNTNIPTYVITESQPGLLGAAAYLNQITAS